MNRLADFAALAFCLVSITCADGTEPVRDETPATVTASRNAASLAIGDSVAVWLEVRNAGGDLLLVNDAAWTSSNTAIAVVAGGMIKAASPGTATVTATLAGISRDVAITVLPPISATHLTVLGQILRAINDRAELQAGSQAAAEAREGQYTFTVRNNKILALEETTVFGHAYAKALAAGETYVVVTEHAGTMDSALVAVQPSLARLSFASGAGGCEGRTVRPVLSGTDAGGTPFQTTAVTFHSLDSSIVLPEAGGLKLLKPGSTRVEAVSDFGAHAYAEAGVAPRSKLQAVLIDGTRRPDSAVIGTNQTILGSFSADGGCTDPAVTATVLDSSVASVTLAPQLTITGKKSGATKVILSAPFMSPDTVPVTVTASRFFLGDDFHGQMVVGDSTRPLFVYPGDSAGQLRERDTDVLVSITSSDTNVLVIDSRFRQFTIDRRSSSVQGFPVKAVAAGIARVTATAPGLIPAQFDYTVAATPRLILNPSDTVMGAGQTTKGSSGGGVPWTLGLSSQTQDAVVSITHSNPAVASTPAQFTVTSIYTAYPFDVDALATGVDTIIATAAGFSPDTAILIVTTPHFVLADDAPVTCVLCNEGALISAGDSLGHRHIASSDIAVLVTADDSSVVTPRISRIFGNVDFQFGVLMTVRDSGQAALHLRDSLGVFSPRDFLLRSVLNTRTRAVADDPVELNFNGVGQVFDTKPGLLLGDRTPTPIDVTYSSTNPAVLPMSGTFTIGANAFGGSVPMVPGAAVGSARLVFVARGFRPDTSDEIVIGVPRLQMTRFPSIQQLGQPDTVIVGLTDQRGRTRRAQSAVTVTLSVAGGGLTPIQVQIPAGATASGKIPVIFTRGGALKLIASGGTATVPYAPDSVLVTSKADPVAISVAAVVATVGIGQRLEIPVVRIGGSASDPVSVTVAARAARADVPASLAFAADIEYQTLIVVGKAAGIDTVTLDATGYGADSLRVVVTEGRLRFAGLPSSPKVGTDYSVTLSATDSSGFARRVNAATEFSVAASPGLSLIDKDGAPVTRVVIAAGETTSPAFTLRASVTGEATILASRLDYVPLRFALTVVP